MKDGILGYYGSAIKNYVANPTFLDDTVLARAKTMRQLIKKLKKLGIDDYIIGYKFNE